MRPDKVIYASSLEDVLVPVTGTLGGQRYDPTGDVVRMAFIPLAQIEPTQADWKAAKWEIDGDQYLATCLVGPGGVVTLAKGRYRIFCALGPVATVKFAGTLAVV